MPASRTFPRARPAAVTTVATVASMAAALTLAAGGCAAASGSTAGAASGDDAARAAIAVPAVATAEPTVGSVLAISVDGLNRAALRRLGPEGTPALHRLIREGASTLNARTEYEMTLTLPNHTGMVTGRRIEAATGGHGVTWNDDRRRPRTVHAAAGHPVASVFSVIADNGGTSALFASKTKFSLWKRSWREGIDHQRIIERNGRLVRVLRADLRERSRDLRFLHLSAPDKAGHDHGFMSTGYLRAVRRTDRLVGRVLATVERRAALRRNLLVLLTVDHGGRGAGHSNPARPANYRVPFLAWGPGVPAGADLYDLNPDYLDPGRRRPTYDEPLQPIRNGALANVALDALGLPAVPGSEHDAAQDLDVFAPVAR